MMGAFVVGNLEGLAEGTTLDFTEGEIVGRALGIAVGLYDGRLVDAIVGFRVGGEDGLSLGREEGFAVGTNVGIDDGVLTGLLPASIHCPHDEVAEYKRVPVVEPYVPVSPVMVTSEPVTAFIPPPDTHAVPPLVAFALVEIGIQLPCDPAYDVSKGRDLLGLPTPVYPELEVNRQPAEQYILAKVTFGQSMGRA